MSKTQPSIISQQNVIGCIYSKLYLISCPLLLMLLYFLDQGCVICKLGNVLIWHGNLWGAWYKDLIYSVPDCQELKNRKLDIWLMGWVGFGGKLYKSVLEEAGKIQGKSKRAFLCFMEHNWGWAASSHILVLKEWKTRTLFEWVFRDLTWMYYWLFITDEKGLMMHFTHALHITFLVLHLFSYFNVQQCF